ncbi:MAG: thermonuclease family protein [Giesbergeria sp.]
MPAAVLLCLVVAISDGDSFTARCGSPGAYETVRVRVAAIDAPEHSQPYGQRARQHLAQLCWRQQARITPVDRDHYGRTVARVQCQGQDAASTQVRAGMAWVYAPRAQAYPHLARLERQARAQRLGLWADAQPVPPWQYRHHNSHSLQNTR